MGVGVNPNEVSRVTTSIGCSTFTAPFKYLGVFVVDNMSRVTTSIGCSTFTAPFKYLGVFFVDNMSRIALWDDIIFKVSNRLSKWKLKTLSIGGRLTLLKSVLSSIPLYHMSIFKAPIGVLNKLEAIRRNFFNGVDGSKNKIAWIDTSWWSRFIQAVHGNHGAFGSRMVSSKGSPWLDIIRDLSTLKSKGIDLMNFMRKKIGNGHNTSFWNDPWLDGEILKSSFHRAFALETCNSMSVASKLNHPSLTHSFRRLPRGGVEEDQVSLLSQRINDVVLPDSNDRWTWNLEGSGLFSVKYARRVIDDTLLPSAGVPTRWIKIIPIKVNILAWRVCLDKIPTRFNLSIKEHELLQTVRDFHACKHEEGRSVSSYVLRMKRYIDNLERLGHPMSLNLAVSLILVSQSKKYDSFVQNYNMHDMGKTVNELHAMLKLHEQTLLKKDDTLALHAIRAGNGHRAAVEAI
ncbi:hypothetical protein Tco_1140843 [Tanacetum coccineum]